MISWLVFKKGGKKWAKMNSIYKNKLWFPNQGNPASLWPANQKLGTRIAIAAYMYMSHIVISDISVRVYPRLFPE